MGSEDFWDGAEIIYKYSDEDAIDDGVLIPVCFGGINRITRSVFDDFDKPCFDSAAFNQFMNKAALELQKQQKEKSDWFYSTILDDRKYFIVDNGSGFTLMKPQDY